MCDAFEFGRLCAGPTLSAGCGLSPPATVNISNRSEQYGHMGHPRFLFSKKREKDLQVLVQ